MADVRIKIRHGLAFYRPSLSSTNEVTAFRGEVVTVPSKEAVRLKALGAAVDADAELALPGRLMPLPNTASDEELLAWVSVANSSEIAAEIAQHPDLRDRIESAVRSYDEQIKAQNELLGGYRDKITEASDAADHLNVTEDDDEEEEFDEDDPREVIKGNVDEVSKYLSENPEQHDAILAAEQERANKAGKEVRSGVVEAVRQAAATTAQ